MWEQISPNWTDSNHCFRYGSYSDIHTEKYFRNLFKSTRNQILFTIYQLIWNQTYVRLDQNQSENGYYNMISIWFNKISKRFLCDITNTLSNIAFITVQFLPPNSPGNARRSFHKLFILLNPSQENTFLFNTSLLRRKDLLTDLRGI